MSNFQLAQLNIADALYPMEDARMDGFTSRIDAVNALADKTDGFVWRLVDEDPSQSGALSLRPFENPNMLVNMSIWRDMKSLYQFVYKTAHAKVMRGKDDWFVNLKSRSMVLWWIKLGHIPTVDEAKKKIKLLDQNGPSPQAFTFKNGFYPNGKPYIWSAPKKDCA